MLAELRNVSMKKRDIFSYFMVGGTTEAINSTVNEFIDCYQLITCSGHPKASKKSSGVLLCGGCMVASLSSRPISSLKIKLHWHLCVWVIEWRMVYRSCPVFKYGISYGCTTIRDETREYCAHYTIESYIQLKSNLVLSFSIEIVFFFSFYQSV